ncbi:hypothetical protein V8F33_010959 [Rhypophila sp. PSN 637]
MSTPVRSFVFLQPAQVVPVAAHCPCHPDRLSIFWKELFAPVVSAARLPSRYLPFPRRTCFYTELTVSKNMVGTDHIYMNQSLSTRMLNLLHALNFSTKAYLCPFLCILEVQNMGMICCMRGLCLSFISSPIFLPSCPAALRVGRYLPFSCPSRHLMYLSSQVPASILPCTWQTLLAQVSHLLSPTTAAASRSRPGLLSPACRTKPSNRILTAPSPLSLQQYNSY